MSTPLWTPSAARIERARITAFRKLASDRSGESLPDYDALWAWSVREPAAFWSLLAEHLGVRLHAAPVAVLEHPVMPGATWFRGATLNFAENLLRTRSDRPAIVSVDESGAPARVLSFDDLRVQVARFQAFLVAHGVGVGDRVAAWMPNREETVIAMLAAAGLGATFSSSSPDFGVQGVFDRFGQIQPKVLITSDGSRYGGKSHSMMDKVREVASRLGEGLAAVVVVPLVHESPDVSGLPGGVVWTDAVANDAVEPTFVPLPFDHPLYILFSSGTTGVPKCIVHGAGGTLLQHGKELALHTDLGPGDVLFYFTTCGWMMWNWLVSGLFTGTTIVLWDGSPAHPTTDALWRMVAAHGVTAFGTSPKYLSMCAKEGVEPGRDLNLSRLRTVLSTGSPLSPDNFSWVYEHVGEDVQLASICGGTDIVSCFMLGAPTEPVWSGEIQKRGLGMAVAAWRGQDDPVVGEKAELVCTVPFPSMPIGFWNDPDGAKYHKAYFDTFPGVWRHGDWIELTEHGGVIVYGRSDATLNPGGVRIGTAEIDRPVEAQPEVADCVVVGLPVGDDVDIVLFVVLKPDHTLDDALISRIKTAIRSSASPRHVPARILSAPAVPRTISGKKVEIAVLRALCGDAVPNRDAMANPDVIDWFASEGRRLVGR